jgi:hypothetical protein
VGAQGASRALAQAMLIDRPAAHTVSAAVMQRPGPPLCACVGEPVTAGPQFSPSKVPSIGPSLPPALRVLLNCTGLTQRFFDLEETKVVFAVVFNHLIESKRAGKSMVAALFWGAKNPGEGRLRAHARARMPCERARGPLL